MTLLKSPPTLKHLSRAYFELGTLGARAVGQKHLWPYRFSSAEELFCLTSEMARYDPRLFGILVEFVIFHWENLNPLCVRRFIKAMNAPQIAGVIFEFARGVLKNFEFGCFADYITRGLEPIAPQLFFRSLTAPASHTMRLTAQTPVHEFLKWGFIARERPVLHGATRQSLGSWNSKTRQNIILELAERHSSFTIHDYLGAIDHTISRQQALNDLKGSKWVKMKGQKRGSRWVKKR
ncbi:MAG: hypothetical protein ACD_62C00330G0001 [uncultured bacterium]|nr:MAG: hypothetical protein ACD_62C00330G0001 [uncultured bacterium]HLD44861.1 hypothetical protein [bacterium]